MKFAFYDLETTGISPAFDQPLQFAAILTDDMFAEIERVEFRCRLAPHVIPSPMALAVTGVGPALLTDPELPTPFEFMGKVGAVIKRWAPAVWTGFNSIRFDEEFLRQGFYQNLQPDVYATQFDGNARFDVLTALQAVWCREPDFIDWPVDEEGNLRLKLDQIAPRTGFAGHNAHDALGDVEATIHVARQIAERIPDLWEELLDNREKVRVKDLLETFQPLILIERYDRTGPVATLGCFCGYSDGNPNQAGFFDLEAADPASYCSDADDRVLSEAVHRSSGIIRPFAINKSPALLSFDGADAEAIRRARIIAGAPEFRARVAKALAERFPDDPSAPPPPIEKRIFEDFYGRTDKARLSEFQRSDWRRRQEIAAELDDPRLRQLARRLVAFYAPEMLSPTEHSRYRSWLRTRWLASDGVNTEWMTLAKARAEMEDLRSNRSVEPPVLEEMAAFMESLGAGLSA